MGLDLSSFPPGLRDQEDTNSTLALVLTLGQALCYLLDLIIPFGPHNLGSRVLLQIPFLKKAFEAQREWLEGTELERGGGSRDPDVDLVYPAGGS